jgi:mRNA interferase MazF
LGPGQGQRSVVSRTRYQPDRGDFVWLDFTPQAGTEQSGRRPALILSPRAFNTATGLAVACPLTSQVKGGSFEVPVPAGEGLSGVVLVDHLRSVDWLERNAEFKGKASKALVSDVVARIAAIIEVD